jgi:hypothetical protein
MGMLYGSIVRDYIALARAFINLLCCETLCDEGLENEVER